ncbi:MAG: citrate synthase [Acholeplasmatales bacterium]|nr:citrate synthase [Acholeplasmatales bacterium]
MKDFLLNQYNNLLENESIDNQLYDKYEVKRGLRNNNGTGVLVGLTKVAEVSGYYVEDNVKKPKEGNLYYRGYDISEVAKLNGDDFGYEKTCFLLLFGHYPNEEEAKAFQNILKDEYDLPEAFLENIILKNPSKSLMNHITRSILSLYSFDDNPDDIDGFSLIKKGVSMIAKMPAIISYSLQAKTHYLDHDSLHIHFPKTEYSFAENILYLSRNDGKFTELEAKTLDMALVVHADHGGGNNSAFVGTVVSSTLTDVYSMIAASMASLKGPRHGGANMAVIDMMNQAIEEIGYDASDEEITNIINKILNKEYFDKTGLIYGIGHAIYTISDPRCELLREEARKLASEKNSKKFDFYYRFEKLAISILEAKKGTEYCANVDFYSGLIYEMLNIPRDLFIPMFAAARLVGWLAHDIENLLYCNKIVRPAFRYVGDKLDD